MITKNIAELVQYGIAAGLLDETDRIYTINSLLELFGIEDYEEPECLPEITNPADFNLEGLLKEMLDYAIDGTNPHLRIVNDPAQMAALLENAVPRENDRMGRRIGNLGLSIALIDGSYTEMEFLADQAPEELLTGLFGSELLTQPYGDGVPGTRAETAETFW